MVQTTTPNPLGISTGRPRRGAPDRKIDILLAGAHGGAPRINIFSLLAYATDKAGAPDREIDILLADIPPFQAPFCNRMARTISSVNAA